MLFMERGHSIVARCETLHFLVESLTKDFKAANAEAFVQESELSHKVQQWKRSMLKEFQAGVQIEDFSSPNSQIKLNCK